MPPVDKVYEYATGGNLMEFSRSGATPSKVAAVG